MKKVILAILLSAISFYVFADSPLTSTSFYSAYQDLKQIEYVLEKGMDKKVVKMLASKKTDIVVKLAAINAMGWGDTTLVYKFEEHLLKKRKGLKLETFDYLREVEGGLPEDTEQTLLLTADDLTCWAYLQCMGDYFNPSFGMKAANLGFARDYKSMAHALPLALIASQVSFDFDWCNVYKIPYAMLVEQEYSENIVTDEAVNMIMDYIDLYKADCE